MDKREYNRKYKKERYELLKKMRICVELVRPPGLTLAVNALPDTKTPPLRVVAFIIPQNEKIVNIHPLQTAVMTKAL